jgi:hypothetical protein
MAIAMERQTVVTPANQVSGPKQGNWTYHHYAALPAPLLSKIVPTIAEVAADKIFA